MNILVCRRKRRTSPRGLRMFPTTTPLRIRINLLVIIAIGLIAASASAGPLDEAILAGHLTVSTQKFPCAAGAPREFACDQQSYGYSGIQHTGLVGQPYFLYLLVLDIDPDHGLGGAAFGISYNGAPNSGLDIFNWTRCADREYPNGNWPAAGSENVVVWNLENCQAGVDPTDPQGEAVAVLGFFYVVAYSPDVFQFVGQGPDEEIGVADCSAAVSELPPRSTGQVGFGREGCDPCYYYLSCYPTPVQATTWGEIKKLE